MKTPARFPASVLSVTALSVVVLAGFPSAAFAQDGDSEGTAPPSGVTVAFPPCRLAEHGGIDDADAQTAARLVCSEIAHAGAPPTARYRVSLGKLGSIIILSVAREGDTPGSTVDSREIRLQGIEEVTVAAPRVADSIVHGTDIHDTEKVDNLVGQETRAPKSKPGKVHFALGLVGILPPLTESITPAPGVDFDVHYEASQFEVGGAVRFGASSTTSTTPGVAFFNLSVGGRYYVSETDFSPYIGGGFSWAILSLNIPNGFDGNASGLGAFADAGIEVLRTHHAHLAIGARLDLPFFSLNGGSGVSGTAGGSASPMAMVTQPTTRYYAPLSLEVRLTF